MKSFRFASLLANNLWQFLCRKESIAFSRNILSCRETQERYLSLLVAKNKTSYFGRAHRFSEITSPRSYQTKLPLTGYDDYSDYIERIANGENNVLTCEPVLMFEPSSGSTAARKLIPYTRSLKKEFQAGIKPWIYETFSSCPEVKRGRAYWSISPPIQDQIREGNIPVGFDSDSSYLGSFGEQLFARTSIQPDVSAAGDVEAFRARTLAALYTCQDLSLISVWSPSFLRLMLNWGEKNRDAVLKAIRESGIRLKNNRLELIAENGKGVEFYQALWPNLKLISCWADGNSRQEFKQLQEILPWATYQQKGLVATEAMVSFPYREGENILAICSHFFEFISPGGDILLAHELQEGETYEVVVSTGGGFYRYRLNDNVVVTGFSGTTPTVKFLSKTDAVSDYYGEKISSGFVAQILQDILPEGSCSFAMLAPDDKDNPLCYTLFIEAKLPIDQDLAEVLEYRLLANPHYRFCREISQLAKARIYQINGHAVRSCEARLIEQGIRIGDIKFPVLSNTTGWTGTFSGQYLTARNESTLVPEVDT